MTSRLRAHYRDYNTGEQDLALLRDRDFVTLDPATREAIAMLRQRISWDHADATAADCWLMDAALFLERRPRPYDRASRLWPDPASPTRGHEHGGSRS